MSQPQTPLHLGWPSAFGLYSPEFEHDACGVGFVAHLKGKPSRQIIDDADRMLRHMDHRGACGCEENTGDGSGMMTAIPDRFLRKVADRDLGIELPVQGLYAVGNVFLPTDNEQREFCKEVVNEIIAKQGQKLLGWREVPTSAEAADIGPTARANEPVVEQLYIAAAPGLTQEAFERQLFIIRKWASRHVRTESEISQALMFFICTLSTKVLVYKGMLTSSQVMRYYQDLQDRDFTSHLAMVHSRFSTNTFPSWDRAHPNRTWPITAKSIRCGQCELDVRPAGRDGVRDVRERSQETVPGDRAALFGQRQL